MVNVFSWHSYKDLHVPKKVLAKLFDPRNDPLLQKARESSIKILGGLIQSNNFLHNDDGRRVPE